MSVIHMADSRLLLGLSYLRTRVRQFVAILVCCRAV